MSEIVEGVEERSGETCVLNVPLNDCLWPDAQAVRLVLEQGIALSVILPDASDPSAIAVIGTLTLQIIAPPWSTRFGEQEADA